MNWNGLRLARGAVVAVGEGVKRLTDRLWRGETVGEGDVGEGDERNRAETGEFLIYV